MSRPGLQKMPVTIPLGVGLRTDIDPKLLPLGALLELENARHLRTGEIVKRPGGAALPNDVNSSVLAALTTAPWQLANYKADLIRLGRVGPQPISRWSPTMAKWTYVDWGTYTNKEPPIQSALRGPFSTTIAPVSAFGADSNAKQPDVAVGGGYVFTAYLNAGAAAASGTVVLVATDAATGEPVWTYAVTGATNRFPRLAISGNYVVLAWVNDTAHTIGAVTVAMDTVKNAAPTIGTYAVGATAHATNPWFDTITDGLKVVMAWRSSTNKLLAAEVTASTGATTNYEIKTAAAASIDPVDALGFVQNIVGYANLGILTANSTAVGVQVNAGFRGTGASTVTHVLDAGYAVPFAGVAYQITGTFTTVSATAEVNALYTGTQLKFAEYTAGAAYAGTFARSVGLASKLFTLPGGDTYVITLHHGTSWASYYVQRVTLNMLSTPPSPSGAARAPLAKIMPGRAANQSSLSTVASAPSIVGAGWVTALEQFNRVRIDAESSPAQTTYNGVANVTLNTDTVLGKPVEAADALYVPGAQLTVFDGQTFADDGVAFIGDVFTATSAVGAGLAPGQIFRYVQVFAYTDRNGRTNRSAPSLPVQQTVGGGDGKMVVTGNYLDLTQRALAFTGQIVVETYKTKDINAGGSATLYYLLHVQANDTSLQSYTFDDVTADASVGQPLYTNAGVLQNDIAPGFSALAVFQNRLFGASMDFGGADSWYTDEFVDGQAPRWSSSRVAKNEDARGRVYGYAVLDDKLVGFKATGVYVLTGQGADALGNGATYQWQLVSGVHGCTNPRSIVVTPDGVMFQSTSARAGFVMLNRGMDLDDTVGAPVRAYAETITGSCLVPAQSQVRFYTASGRTLVYDLLEHDWATYTGQPAIAATCWADATPVYGRIATADVMAEDATGTLYTEDWQLYTMRVATPWIQFAKLAGYQRWYQTQGVGERVTDHTIVASFFKNFDESWPFLSQIATPGARWDWVTSFSSKLSALKVVIEETSAGAGAKMTALAMVLGIKAGLRKLPSINRTVG